MDSPAVIFIALVLALSQSLPAIAETPAHSGNGYSINTSQREAVRLFYNTVFRSSDGVESGWNGDIDSCDAGDTSADYKAAVVRRINWFRAMAGVPANVELDPELNAKAQQAALLMAANGSLSHSPPSHWTCYGADADEAAGRSNLSLGRAGADAVTFGYLEDPGASNSAVGHRRWLLYPQTLRMGTGDVHGSHRSNALWVVSSPFTAPRPPVRDEFVAWPPPGHVPFDVVFPRWSISYPDADFSDASVSMSRDGVPVPVQLEPAQDGYGENTLVWLADGYVDGDRWERPGADTEYQVVVDNVTVDNDARSFSYSVTVFDPDQEAGAPAAITALGMQEESSAFVYRTSQTEGALQYQWRQAMLAPFELHDTADDGLANFIVSRNTGYQAHIGADNQGDSFFRLAHPSGRDRDIPEALELHGELLPGPSAQLQFGSRLGWSTSSQIAAVEVSADGGLSWQPVHEQVGDGSRESSFSEKRVSLAAWQGRTVRLRFHYIKEECAGCSYYPYSGQAGLWEIDDIQLSGVEAVSEPTESSPLSRREISFSPVQAGRQLLQSRAGMYGHFSDWSSAHVLTVAEADLQPGTNPDVVFAPPSGPVEPIPPNVPPDDVWPGPFNGVMPDPALELPVNNIGLLDRSADKVYSCVRFLLNGQQSQLDGFERMDITFDVLPGQQLTLQVREVRAFNPGNALNEFQELPDCSGTFEMSTEVYSDTLERDGAVFHDEFDLVDGGQLIFGLRDSQEVPGSRPFKGVMPDPALGLPFNNIGLLDRSVDKVYSCVRFLMDGQQSQLDGFERMGLTFDVLPGEELALQVLEARAFNPGNALNAALEPPDCSGTFEFSTGVYSDTIDRDGSVFHDEFDLVDDALLIFGLRDSQEVLAQ